MQEVVSLITGMDQNTLEIGIKISLFNATKIKKYISSRGELFSNNSLFGGQL